MSINLEDVNPSFMFTQWVNEVVCPKCQGPLTRHIFRIKEGEMICTYHCDKDGDVIPKIREG